jgi:hypothetical protein
MALIQSAEGRTRMGAESNLHECSHATTYGSYNSNVCRNRQHSCDCERSDHRQHSASPGFPVKPRRGTWLPCGDGISLPELMIPLLGRRYPANEDDPVSA